MGSLAEGHVLAGRYRLLSPLGRGAMGEVWKAEHVGLGTPVAVKVIVDAEYGEGSPKRPELVARFFREAQAAAKLRSPHVVQIFDHGDANGVPYMAMELLEGETLEERLERDGKLSPQKTAEVIAHMARGVGKAHEAGIVHRDLKPGNVFLVKNDDQEIAKVLDFGIAKVTNHADAEKKEGVMTRTGSVVGTPCYMSPEQALGSKTIDYRADLWSMAIIAFECLVGQRPFDGDALGELIVQICAKPMPVPSQIAPVPEGFDAWFAKAASREPGDRFPSARAMADALREVLAVENMRMTQPSISMVAPAPSSVPASVDAFAQTANQLTHPGVVSAITDPSRKRRSPAVIGVGALAVTVALGAGIFALVRGGTPTAEGSTPIASVHLGAQPAPSASIAAAPGPGTTATQQPSVAPTPTVTESATASPPPSSKPSSTARPGPSVRPGPTAKPASTKDRLGF